MDGKSKLFKYGGEGCIFIPEIPCKKTKKTKKNRKRKVNGNKRSIKRKTKLLYLKDLSNEDKINNFIKKKSKNYREWCILWENSCMSKDYKSLKQISEVEKCFSLNNKRIPDDNQSFKLLQGEFVGRSPMNYYSKIFDLQLMNNKRKFITEFIYLFNSMERLFLGLVELQKIGVCHHDIKYDNVILYDEKLYYIDFGLALKFNETKKLNDRMKEEFLNGRIYEAYPFEYIYYPRLTTEQIKNEEEDIVFGEHRKDYEFTLIIQEYIFNRDLDHIRYKLLRNKFHKTKSPDIKRLIKHIDTYSLGVLPFIILIECCHKNNIDLKILVDVLLTEELKPYLELFRAMTEPNYKDRISPTKAYQRYLNLMPPSLSRRYTI